MTHCIIQNTNITKIEKIINLKYSEAVRTVEDWCTANGVKKKSNELKKKYLTEKIKVSE